ncbi:MAG: hypothetical protein HZA78_04425 [Candidatus Schekmanbacteria bacterium]|nr:hypothetical protein [Candidatus Schekmanbacteria bacterium]
MRKKYAVSCIMAAFLSLMGVSKVRAENADINMEMFLGDMVYTSPAGQAEVSDLPGIYQTTGILRDPGKGEALKDACRCKGSTLLINAKVNVRTKKLGLDLYAKVTFTLTPSGSVPAELNFTIPGEQAEQTVDFPYNVKDLNQGVFTLTAKLVLRTGSPTGPIYIDGAGQSEWIDAENVIINTVELNTTKIIACDPTGLGYYPMSYTINEGYIDEGSGNYYPCQITSGSVKVYDSTGGTKTLKCSIPLTSFTGNAFNWNGLVLNGQCLSQGNSGLCLTPGTIYIEMEIFKQVYIDNNVPVAELKDETASSALGTTSGEGTVNLYAMDLIAPDTGSGVNLDTVTATLLSVTADDLKTENGDVVLDANGNVISLSSMRMSGFSNKVLTDSDGEGLVNDAKFTLMRTSTDYYTFVEGRTYMLTVNVSDGGAEDNAGNEWDVDPSKTNIQKNFRWFFKVGAGALTYIDPDGAASNYDSKMTW